MPVPRSDLSKKKNQYLKGTCIYYLGTACPSGEIRGNFLGVRNKKSPE
jgi:hypothetical protein